MMRELDHIQLLRYVGMVTWALVGCWLLNAWLDPDYLRLAVGESVWARIMPWLVVYFTFGVCYWWITRSIGRSQTRWFDHLALLVMTVCAIGVSYFSATGLGSVLLMVMAALLPWILSVRVGLVWMLAGNLAFVPLFVMAMNYSPILAVIQALLYVGFSGLVFVTAFVAMQQATAREEQRRLNSELRATRALLAESARVNERTRISRELHDLLGHHLTALSLNLEVAGHLAEGKTRDHVRQAHTLAKLLLTDVREAVSHMRESGGIELASALLPLAENVPGLEVQLDIREGLRVEDPDLAHVLLRTTQEIITNAVRHSGATELRIEVDVSKGEIFLTAQDNGLGTDLVTAGNGLSGMRERIKAQDGKMDIRTAPGQGFSIHVSLPLQTTVV